MAHRMHRERGQAVPLVLMVVVFSVAVALGLVRMSRTAAERAAAGHAADAAALAGAVDGEPAAAAIARANRAVLVSFHQEGDIVTVVVQRGSSRATARAELVAELTGE